MYVTLKGAQEFEDYMQTSLTDRYEQHHKTPSYQEELEIIQ